jgi:phosphatidylserine decarboxylase
VINLFAPGKVNLVNSLQSLSVTKIGQPLAISTETFVTPEVEPAPLAEEEIKAEHDASPLVDDKNDQG